MSELYNIGDHVRYNGRDYTVFTVTRLHYGLVDPALEPKINDHNGQQVSHIAVLQTEVEAAA